MIRAPLTTDGKMDNRIGGQEQNQMTSPQLPSQALTPSVAAGYPVEQNPSVDTLGEWLVSAMQYG